jgi:hypothetical protein
MLTRTVPCFPSTKCYVRDGNSLSKKLIAPCEPWTMRPKNSCDALSSAPGSHKWCQMQQHEIQRFSSR